MGHVALLMPVSFSHTGAVWAREICLLVSTSIPLVQSFNYQDFDRGKSIKKRDISRAAGLSLVLTVFSSPFTAGAGVAVEGSALVASHDCHWRPPEDLSPETGPLETPKPTPQTQTQGQKEAQEWRGGGERQAQAVLPLRVHCPLWHPGTAGGHCLGCGGLLAKAQPGLQRKQLGQGPAPSTTGWHPHEPLPESGKGASRDPPGVSPWSQHLHHCYYWWVHPYFLIPPGLSGFPFPSFLQLLAFGQAEGAGPSDHGHRHLPLHLRQCGVAREPWQEDQDHQPTWPLLHRHWCPQPAGQGWRHPGLGPSQWLCQLRAVPGSGAKAWWGRPGCCSHAGQELLATRTGCLPFSTGSGVLTAAFLLLQPTTAPQPGWGCVQHLPGACWPPCHQPTLQPTGELWAVQHGQLHRRLFAEHLHPPAPGDQQWRGRLAETTWWAGSPGDPTGGVWTEPNRPQQQPHQGSLWDKEAQAGSQAAEHQLLAWCQASPFPWATSVTSGQEGPGIQPLGKGIS